MIKITVEGKKPISVINKQYKTTPENVSKGVFKSDDVSLDSSSPSPLNSLRFNPVFIIRMAKINSRMATTIGNVAASGIKLLVNVKKKTTIIKKKMPINTS